MDKRSHATRHCNAIDLVLARPLVEDDSVFSRQRVAAPQLHQSAGYAQQVSAKAAELAERSAVPLRTRTFGYAAAESTLQREKQLTEGACAVRAAMARVRLGAGPRQSMIRKVMHYDLR